MELNLRKARKLENKINHFISTRRYDLVPHQQVRVNADVKTDVLPMLSESREEFLNSFDNIGELIDARFEIRQLIAKANISSGINDAILEKVRLENRAAAVNDIANRIEILNEEELQDESERQRTIMANGDRFSSSSFSAYFMKLEDKEGFKKKQVELAKQIEALEDKLLELNYLTKIELSNELVSLLQANSLL